MSKPTSQSQGSLSRKVRCRAQNSQAERQRQKRNRARAFAALKHGSTSQEPPRPPQGRAYLMRCFWDHFGLSALLSQAGVHKFKGLAASTLLFIALLFGVMNVTSISALAVEAGRDQVLTEACAMEWLERKSLYRFLAKMTEAEYREWHKGILRALQQPAGTASRSDGVVAGDDTTVLRFGPHMPGIALVYHHGLGIIELGYSIVSTLYADPDKFYPLLFQFRLQSEAEKKEAEERRKRRKLGIDRRSPGDVARWMAAQTEEGSKPDLAFFRGTCLCGKLVQKADELTIPWMGLSPTNRLYTLVGKKEALKAKTFCQQEHKQWQTLKDEGYQVAILGPATAKELGDVLLVVVKCLEDDHLDLYVLPRLDESQVMTRLEQMLARPGEADPTKLTIMLDLLRQDKQELGIRAETATFDRWYYVVDFIVKVLALGFKRVVIKAKRNIPYLYQGEWLTIEEIRPRLPAADYEDCSFKNKNKNNETTRLASVKVEQKGLGRIQLVFVEEINRQGKVSQSYALMCTDVHYAAADVYRAHKLRWRIEEFYRGARQDHGFEDFHSRNWNAIFGHITLSCVSFLAVAVTKYLNPKLKDKTLGWIVDNYFNVLVELKPAVGEVEVCFTERFLTEYGLPTFCT